MKKTIVLLMALSVAVISMSLDIYSSSGKEGFTGSPSESNCRACHSGMPLNDPSGSLVITAPTMTDWKYTPGQTYVINVTVTKPGATIFGFGFEALTSANIDAGTLTSPDKNTLIIKAPNKRTNVIHQTNTGKSNDTHTFTFNWTAPATSVGTVTFYTSGNATNGNGQASGDYVYTATQTVSNTVGIKNQEAANLSISLHPNPANEYIYINNTSITNENMRVTIIDITGRVMLTEENLISNGVINVSMLSKGNYIARIDKNSGVVIKRFIKN